MIWEYVSDGNYWGAHSLPRNLLPTLDREERNWPAGDEVPKGTLLMFKSENLDGTGKLSWLLLEPL
jgi:hypothetical protein